MIIVLEGIDNCGKNTIAQLLVKKYPLIKKIDFPDYSSPLGKLIKEELSRGTLSPISLQLLFSSERLSKKNDLINITKDSIVLTTRYFYSAIAYGSARGINKKLLYLLEEELPPADIKIFLSISPEESILRSNTKDDIFESDLSFLKSVDEEYKEILCNDDRWNIVNGMQSIEDVFNDVENVVKSYKECAIWMKN